MPKNIIAVASGRIGETYDRAVKAHLADYMGLTFENMCRQYLLYYAEDLPIAMCDLGQWWGTDRKTRRQVQIDIIGCPAEGSEYIIGSCKYKKEKTGKRPGLMNWNGSDHMLLYLAREAGIIIIFFQRPDLRKGWKTPGSVARCGLSRWRRCIR